MLRRVAMSVGSLVVAVGAVTFFAAAPWESSRSPRVSDVAPAAAAAAGPTVASDHKPVWSPDGRSVAFVRDVWDGADGASVDGAFVESQVWLVRADGLGERRLGRSGVDRARLGAAELVWSPDSRRIAYASDRGGVHVVDVDGAHERALTTNASDRPASWSRDGRRILFVRPGSLMTVGVRTGHVTRLIRLPRVDDARWSPDGRRLAVTTMSEEVLGRDEYYELVVMTADGRRPRRVAIDVLGGDASSIHFAWSPDGSRLAFTSEHRLYVAPATGAPRRLRAPGEVQGVSWSPNGRRLVWNTEYGALHVAEPNGRHARALVTRETVEQQLQRGRSEPAWIQAGAWAPGREIAFSMAFRCPSSFDLHVVNATTGVIRRVTTAAC